MTLNQTFEYLNAYLSSGSAQEEEELDIVIDSNVVILVHNKVELQHHFWISQDGFFVYKIEL